MSSTSAGRNRLGDETSPYLLQHRDNPVHWWAWGPEALAEAKAAGKPILLSVGYAACHWCHVMAHESFENDDTAALMNELFVNIKVDREERPDIDAIYMDALHRLGEHGGWPLTMFLDSEARPFWGGTYFPPESRFGKPGFRHVLREVARIFRDEPDKVRQNADGLTAMLRREPQAGPGVRIDDDFVRGLVARLTQAVDEEHGGLQGAPKFPQWSIFWLLWRGAIRYANSEARTAVLTTLTNICQGGIYDHLRGGFARYSVDARWLVPHFEKMLYDNALLIDLLTEAWRETRDPLYRERIEETVGWLEAEMLSADAEWASEAQVKSADASERSSADQKQRASEAHRAAAERGPEAQPTSADAKWASEAQVKSAVASERSSTDQKQRAAEAHRAAAERAAEAQTKKAFAASLDADSEGEEGKFCVWAEHEILELLGPEDGRFFCNVYDVTAGGNFEEHGSAGHAPSSGRSILNRLHSMERLSQDQEDRLASLRAKLLAARDGRIRPGWDDKVLADWNGLMIASLSRASIVFDRPAWLALARDAFHFVVANMGVRPSGSAVSDPPPGLTPATRLLHSYRAGKAKAPATSSDYANMIWAALRLYEATADAAYLDQGRAWTAVLDTHYWHAAGGYCTAADDTPDVIARLRVATDDATPNANAIMLANLSHLFVLTGDSAYMERAEAVLAAFGSDIQRNPVAHCGLFANALDVIAPQQVAVVRASPAKDSGALGAALHALSIPGAIEQIAEHTLQTETAPGLTGKKPVAEADAAYVCLGTQCSPPVTSASDLAAALRTLRTA